MNFRYWALRTAGFSLKVLAFVNLALGIVFFQHFRYAMRQIISLLFVNVTPESLEPMLLCMNLYLAVMLVLFCVFIYAMGQFLDLMVDVALDVRDIRQGGTPQIQRVLQSGRKDMWQDQ